ncbi:MAG: TonB-dependent receptor, partial [bacterium]|nr:TonB-dependent receptor [bacterium]
RDLEAVSNTNQIFGLKYSGDIWKLRNLNLSLSQRNSDETQTLTGSYGFLNRELFDRTINFNAEKSFDFTHLKLLFAYQFERVRFDFSDVRSDFSSSKISNEAARINRSRHGLVSIIKVHAPGGSDVLKIVDFDLSFRRDQIKDELDPTAPQNTLLSFENNQWHQSTVKFAARFNGYYQNFLFDVFMNIGNNVKFPSLSQLISSRLVFDSNSLQFQLKPEKNRSVEIGLILKRELRSQPVIYGWQFSASYITNHYDNKFRPYFIIGLPVAFFDNVATARITGYESRSSIFLLRKKVTAEFGIAYYDISERAAFPFKYDLKIIANLIIDHAGYSLKLHWFKEGRQTGWIRQLNGNFSEVLLADFTNVDFHLSKTFSVWKLKLFANLSLRNLLNDDAVLEGLALRDRRYYLTFGIQY